MYAAKVRCVSNVLAAIQSHQAAIADAHRLSRCCRDPLVDVARFGEHGGHVLVGTPGRIMDVFERSGGKLDLKCLEVPILDCHA